MAGRSGTLWNHRSDLLSERNGYKYTVIGRASSLLEEWLRAALDAEFKRLHRELLARVRADPVCRHSMSVPGVGAVVAISFKSGVEDPARFGARACRPPVRSRE